jgi:hypothetical protein
MSLAKWKGFLASCAFVLTIAVVVDGCSSSSNGDMGGAADAAQESSHLPPRGRDGAPDVTTAVDSGVDAAVAPFDGTTGQQCTSNADCKGTMPGAPGTNVCSNTYNGQFAIGGVNVSIWPTPVCILPLASMTGNCDPGDGTALQFCDSADPNDPTSPGICLPRTFPPTPGQGNGDCYPACTFATDGSPAVGCQGSNACVNFTFLLNINTSAVTGFGFCEGGCQTDADCSKLGAGWGCQTDLSYCTRAKKTRTKAIGTACTNTGTTSDTTTGACYCPFAGSSTTAFYCTQHCVVGGTPCPTGYVCETFEPASLVYTGIGPDGGDLTLPGPVAQGTGLRGFCLASCGGADGGTGDAGAVDSGSDAEGGASTSADSGGSLQCPPLSTCRAPSDMNGTVAGPDCQP